MGAAIMTEEADLKREIVALRESIRFDWAKLASRSLTADQRKVIREHCELCNRALKNRMDRLDQFPTQTAVQIFKAGLRQRRANSNSLA